MNLSILFENPAVVVLCKPAGAGCEDTGPAGAGSTSVPFTVPSLLRQHWKQPRAPVFCVHRLDTVTGGVMVYAKTKQAAAALSAQITAGALQKEYWCVCAGSLTPPAGEMHDFLFKDSRANKVYPVKSRRKGAKEALLEYALLGTMPAAVPGETPGPLFSLCRVRLHTGRTHQIRVQFASRKHPLWGDGKYGSRQKGPLGLWCASLTFTVPGETAPRTFSAAPPTEQPWCRFAALLPDVLR